MSTMMVTPDQRRRSTAIATRTGLTRLGVAVVVSSLSLPGALLDLRIAGHLSWCFAASFCLGSVVAALRVRRRAMTAALTTPPLVLGLVVLVLAMVQGEGEGMSGRVLDVLLLLTDEAPALVGGLSAAAAVLLWRWRR